MTSEPSEYESKDFENIINYVHHELCNKDKRGRKADKAPKWQSLEKIVKKMKGYPQTTDVWYIAEQVLKDERGFIERHPKNFKVKLTKEGRELCGQRLREEESSNVKVKKSAKRRPIRRRKNK
jgi:hypothetical protein